MSRAVIFAHHDPDGLFDPAVAHAVFAYRAVADHLTVVSTSARLVPPGLAGCIDHFVPRENVGHDFCSWRAGIESLDAAGRFDEIVCVNDSVYGPLFDLGPVLRNPRIASADFFGMCLSGQDPSGPGCRPHLQSWFFGMRRSLLASRVFAEFWNGVVPLPSKKEIVARYELGMSRAFAEAGFPPSAIYDATRTPRVRFRRILPHLSLRAPARSWRLLRKASQAWPNPSELRWDELIESGVPFVKASIFRVNHYGLDPNRVMEGLGRLGGFDVDMIRGHLRRVGEA